MPREITHLHLAALDKVFAIASAPDGGRPTDPLPRQVHAAVRALGLLDAAVGTGADPAGEHASLQIAMAKTKAATQAARDALTRAESALFAPPKSDDAAMDAELRQWVRSLPDERRAKFMEEMGKGQHVGALQALARLPVPDPLAETARGLYRSFAERDNPQAVADFEAQRSAISWAESATAALGRVLDDATTSGTLPASVLIEG